MEALRHTITAFVQDKPGVLNRVASMFRRRGFNIASLAVGRSEVPNFSRMTFVVDGDSHTVEQVTKQLRKLIDVVKVTDISKEVTVARELALIKVRATPATRSEIIQIVSIFRANIIDVSHESLVIEVTGDEDKVESLFNLLKAFGELEMVRTGVIAMVRGAGSTTEEVRSLKVNGSTVEEAPTGGNGHQETGSV